MNKHPIFILIFLSFITLTTTSSSSFANSISKHTILLLGDSVSASYRMQQNQGWVRLLNEQLKVKNSSYKIVNASISGETTTGGLSRLPGILSKTNINHLVIELGGNDGLRGYSPKKIKNNLLQMIKLAHAKNIPVSLYKIKITPNYGPRYNKLFEQVFIDVAVETSSNLLDFFVEPLITNESLMQQDGIHPNAKAQPIIAEFVAKQFAKIMEK
ncbi:MAG: arylesterase [Colwellia sp.]|nr:arylesterase [Colwellia sp.]